jgi:hypothetical protein
VTPTGVPAADTPIVFTRNASFGQRNNNGSQPDGHERAPLPARRAVSVLIIGR